VVVAIAAPHAATDCSKYMENLSLEVAYARYGAEVSNKQRNLSSVASDGSLVLSCPAERFSRPGVGILRYSAQISLESGTTPRVVALRAHIQSAQAGGVDIRPVVITPAKGTTPRVIHVRQDLVGRVVEYDGDNFVVDFTRATPPAEPKGRRRR
jgi:hypothetical protein